MLIRELYACSQGAASFGTTGRFATTSEPADAQKYIDLLTSYGHNAIDAARIYGGGTTEEVSNCACVVLRVRSSCPAKVPFRFG
jgi:aryl-alcohol dehydrogenase-like predicted oxidoreductase